MNKLARFTGINIATSILAVVVTAAFASEPPAGKGDARLLMKAPAPAPAPVAEQSSAMACPKCKDQLSARKDMSAKVPNQTTGVLAQHQCAGCNTTISTVGQGKSKHNVATHHCSANTSEMMACCGADKVAAASAK